MKRFLILILALIAALIPYTHAENSVPSDAVGTWYMQELIIPDDLAEIYEIPARLTTPGAEVAVIVAESGELTLQWTDNLGYNGDPYTVYDWNRDLALEYGAINDTKFGDSVGKLQDGRLHLNFAEMTLICGREKPYFDLYTDDIDASIEMYSGIDIWYNLTWDSFFGEDYQDDEEGPELLPPGFEPSEVIGTWYLQEALMNGMPEDVEFIDYRITFEENGIAVHSLADEKRPANWAISGNQVVFTYTDSYLYDTVTLQEDGTLLWQTDEANYLLFSREARETSAIPQTVPTDSVEPLQGRWQMDRLLMGDIIPQSPEIAGATAAITVSGNEICFRTVISKESDFADPLDGVFSDKVFSGKLTEGDGCMRADLTDGEITHSISLTMCEDGSVRCKGDLIEEAFSADISLNFTPVRETPDFCGSWHLESYTNSDGENRSYASVDYCIGILNVNEDGTFSLNMSGDMPNDAYEAIAGENTGLWLCCGSEVTLHRTHGAAQSFTLDPAAGTLMPRPYIAKGLMQFTQKARATLSEADLLGKWWVYSAIAPEGSDTGMSIEFKKNGECVFTIAYEDITDIRVGSWEFISESYLDAVLPDGQALHLMVESDNELSGVNDTCCTLIKAD